MTDIAPLDNRPWVPRPFPSWLIRELARRKDDIGMQYISGQNATWDEKGSWNKYKGPMTPWVRVCSNGNGQSKFLSKYKSGAKNLNGPREGFVLYGGNGFKDTYGIKDNQTILGYDVYGQPHIVPMDYAGLNNYTINNSILGKNNNRPVQSYLPSPGIDSIEAIIQKQFLRSVTIKWHCYGFAQLEYMTPYFLTPAISMVVEFGWNHYNQDSLLDLTNSPHVYKVLEAGSSKEIPYEYVSDSGKSTTNLTLKELWNDGSPLYDCNVRISRGMYDASFGLIKSFEFSSTDGVKYDCITTIGSKNTTWGGINFSNSTVKSESNTQGNNEKNKSMTFPKFVEQRLKKIKNCVDKNLNFMQPLDDSEKNLEILKGVNPNDFYDGKAENRIFFGRGGTNYFGSNNPPGASDWDKSDTDTIWVKMDFLIELMNFFNTRASNMKDFDNSTFQFYKLDTSGKTVLGAHPNLISGDGAVILIPNAYAPKYNNGTYYVHIGESDAAIVGEYDNQALTSEPNKEIFFSGYKTHKDFAHASSSMAIANRELYKTFRTGIYGDGKTDIGAARDDLNSIINFFVYNQVSTTTAQLKKVAHSDNRSHSFPQYIDDPLTKKKAGYYGYLEDLYINADLIIRLVNDSKTTQEFYEKLLSEINQSVDGFWDLKIVSGAPKHIVVVDQKFLPNLTSEPIYQFDAASAKNEMKNISFSSTISNIQANQVIASSTNNQGGDGEESSTAPLDFIYGDRLFKDPPKQKQNLAINDGLTIKQLQTYGPNQPAYIMSFHGGNPKIKNIVNLALPNKALLTSLMNDNDKINNTNIYGGQQPNFTLEFTIQGIAGLNTFQCFSVKNLPKPYSDEDVIFQIVDVSHIINSENWETRIKAGIRPFGANRSLQGTPKYVDGSEKQYQ
jgi:hypothetical protein